MSGINGISQNNMYSQIASGRRINSAADDAAGLTISQKMTSQETGLNQGSENAKDGVSLLNIADGALSQIGDSLQRIYELGVKASNGLNTGEELGAIQSEVDQLLSDIEGIAKGTEFNTMKILDGSMADIDLATKPDGTGQKIQMVSSTLEALGIDGLDFTKGVDLDKICRLSTRYQNQGAAWEPRPMHLNPRSGITIMPRRTPCHHAPDWKILIWPRRSPRRRNLRRSISIS